MCSTIGKKQINSRTIVSIALIIIVFSFILFVFLPSVNASIFDIGTWIRDACIDILNTIRKSHGQTVVDILKSPMLSSITKGDSTADNILNGFLISMKGIGVMFVLVYSLMAILSEQRSTQLSRDKALTIILRVGIAITFILFSDRILNAIQGFMASVNTLIFNNISHEILTDTENKIQEWINSMQGQSFDMSAYANAFFVLIIIRVILWPVSWILDLIIKIMSYSIIIEIAVRKVFIPLALADISHYGMRSGGVRYLKKTAAVYIRLMLWAVAFFVVGELAYQVIADMISEGTGTLSTFLSGLGTVVMYDIAAFTFLKKSSELAEEAMGV